jgi:hypothetical protein
MSFQLMLPPSGEVDSTSRSWERKGDPDGICLKQEQKASKSMSSCESKEATQTEGPELLSWGTGDAVKGEKHTPRSAPTPKRLPFVWKETKARPTTVAGAVCIAIPTCIFTLKDIRFPQAKKRSG